MGVAAISVRRFCKSRRRTDDCALVFVFVCVCLFRLCYHHGVHTPPPHHHLTHPFESIVSRLRGMPSVSASLPPTHLNLLYTYALAATFPVSRRTVELECGKHRSTALGLLPSRKSPRGLRRKSLRLLPRRRRPLWRQRIQVNEAFFMG